MILIIFVIGQGFLWVLFGFGFYFSFCILNIIDMIVEGIFLFGVVVVVILIF